MLGAIYGPAARPTGGRRRQVQDRRQDRHRAGVHHQADREHQRQNADERKRDHAWFIAYAPADDPKIAVSVLVENGGFGAAAAAPIARKVMDAYLVPDEPPADKGKPLTTPPSAPPRPVQPKPLQANNAG